MKKGSQSIVFILIVILLATACGDVESAVDKAKADQIRQETADDAAARAASEARSQADWQATRRSLNFLKQTVLVLLGVTLAVSVLFAAAILLLRLWQASRSFVTYAETRAALKAAAIYVDRQTLTWPTLVADDAVHNLQTGEVYRLSEPRLADPQQVTSDAFIRALGVGSQGAVKIGKSTRDGTAAAETIATLGGALPLVTGDAPSDTRRQYN